MNTIKYLGEISAIGLILILCLSLNVSAIPYISIGNITHNFTVVPGQPADITLPIMVKNINASDLNRTIKGLQFNVTYNCSVINITNITHVGILDVPNAPPPNIIYDKLCNGSPMPPGLRNVFCFFRNTTPVSVGGVNRTNASILIATIRNTSHPDICILRIAFASYRNLTTDAVIGRIKMKVDPMPSYFITNFTLPMNITVERMGLSRDVNINVSNATIHSQAKRGGLIMACRGDVTKDNITGVEERMKVIRASLATIHPNYAPLSGVEKPCLELVSDPIQNRMIIIRASLSPIHPNYLNISNIPIEY